MRSVRDFQLPCLPIEPLGGLFVVCAEKVREKQFPMGRFLKYTIFSTKFLIFGWNVTFEKWLEIFGFS